MGEVILPSENWKTESFALELTQVVGFHVDQCWVVISVNGTRVLSLCVCPDTDVGANEDAPSVAYAIDAGTSVFAHNMSQRLRSLHGRAYVLRALYGNATG